MNDDHPIFEKRNKWGFVQCRECGATLQEPWDKPKLQPKDYPKACPACGFRVFRFDE